MLPAGSCRRPERAGARARRQPCSACRGSSPGCGESPTWAMKPVSAARSGPPPVLQHAQHVGIAAPDAEQRVPHRGRLPDPGRVVDAGPAGRRVHRFHAGQRRGQHGHRSADPDPADRADQQIGAGIDLGVGDPPTGADRGQSVRPRSSRPGCRSAGSARATGSRSGTASLGADIPTSTTVIPTPAASASAAGSPIRPSGQPARLHGLGRPALPRRRSRRCRGRPRTPPVAGAAGPVDPPPIRPRPPAGRSRRPRPPRHRPAGTDGPRLTPRRPRHRAVERPAGPTTWALQGWGGSADRGSAGLLDLLCISVSDRDCCGPRGFPS